MRAAAGLRALLKPACLLTVCLIAAVVPTWAQQNYPDHPIRIVLPFGPGGVGDVITRLVADKLGQRVGQRVVVENYPGPGGINAARRTLQAPADGYTLTYLASATAMSVNLFRDLPFDPVKDFAPISSLGYFDLVFVAAANSPYKTIGDFIEAAKQKPGQLNVGTILPGSTQNLGVELLKSMAGLDVTIVPFRSSGEVLVALERGDVQVGAEFYAALRGGLEAKKVIPLATSGAKRTQYLPDVPTMKEAGAGTFEMTSWSALFAKAKTSPDVISALSSALKATLSDREIEEKALELGVEMAPSTPQEIGDRLAAEIPKWAQVVQAAHIEKR